MSFPFCAFMPRLCVPFLSGGFPASGNAFGKIRHSAVVFASVLIWYECCGIDIFHGSASLAGGREDLPPALLWELQIIN